MTKLEVIMYALGRVEEAVTHNDRNHYGKVNLHDLDESFQNYTIVKVNADSNGIYLYEEERAGENFRHDMVICVRDNAFDKHYTACLLLMAYEMHSSKKNKKAIS